MQEASFNTIAVIAALVNLLFLVASTYVLHRLGRSDKDIAALKAESSKRMDEFSAQIAGLNNSIHKELKTINDSLTDRKLAQLHERMELYDVLLKKSEFRDWVFQLNTQMAEAYKEARAAHTRLDKQFGSREDPIFKDK